VEPEPTGRQAASVEENRRSARARRVLDRRLRIVAEWDERRAARNEAEAVPVEELAEGGCRSRLARRDPRRNLQLERLGRDHGTRKREHAIDNNREAGANDHAELFGVSPQVGCPDRERCGGSAGTGEASELGSRRAV